MRSVGDERHDRGGRGMGGETLNNPRRPPLLEVVHRDSLDHNSLKGDCVLIREFHLAPWDRLIYNWLETSKLDQPSMKVRCSLRFPPFHLAQPCISWLHGHFFSKNAAARWMEIHFLDNDTRNKNRPPHALSHTHARARTHTHNTEHTTQHNTTHNTQHST